MEDGQTTLLRDRDRERRSEREPPVMIEREHSSTPGEVKGILL